MSSDPIKITEQDVLDLFSGVAVESLSCENPNEYFRVTKLMSDPDYDFLSRAYSIVAENISDENWSVGDLATALGIGRTRLHVRITEITGNSSLYFIKAVRFSEAEKLLKQGELPISEISSMVGFRTPAYFSTAFKAFTGFTPKQFQNPRSK